MENAEQNQEDTQRQEFIDELAQELEDLCGKYKLYMAGVAYVLITQTLGMPMSPDITSNHYLVHYSMVVNSKISIFAQSRNENTETVCKKLFNDIALEFLQRTITRGYEEDEHSLSSA